MESNTLPIKPEFISKKIDQAFIKISKLNDPSLKLVAQNIFYNGKQQKKKHIFQYAILKKEELTDLLSIQNYNLFECRTNQHNLFIDIDLKVTETPLEFYKIDVQKEINGVFAFIASIFKFNDQQTQSMQKTTLVIQYIKEDKISVHFRFRSIWLEDSYAFRRFVEKKLVLYNEQNNNTCLFVQPKIFDICVYSCFGNFRFFTQTKVQKEQTDLRITLGNQTYYIEKNNIFNNSFIKELIPLYLCSEKYEQDIIFSFQPNFDLQKKGPSQQIFNALISGRKNLPKILQPYLAHKQTEISYYDLPEFVKHVLKSFLTKNKINKNFDFNYRLRDTFVQGSCYGIIYEKVNKIFSRCLLCDNGIFAQEDHQLEHVILIDIQKEELYSICSQGSFMRIKNAFYEEKEAIDQKNKITVLKNKLEVQQMLDDESANQHLIEQIQKHSITFIESDTGTGKSKFVQQLLKQQNQPQRVLYISCRISLKNDQIETYKKIFPNVFDYQDEDVQKQFFRKAYSVSDFPKQFIFFCQINSIPKFKINPFDVIIFDEALSLMTFICQNPQVLSFIFSQSQMFIVMDAIIRNELIQQFFKLLPNRKESSLLIKNTQTRLQNHIIYNQDYSLPELQTKSETEEQQEQEQEEEKEKDLIFHPQNQQNKLNQCYILMQNLIKQNKKFTASFDHLNDLENILAALVNNNIILKSRILVTTGEQSQEFKKKVFSNINDHIKENDIFCWFYSSTVTVGVSLINEEFTDHIAFFDSGVLQCFEQYQMLYRSRCAVNFHQFLSKKCYRNTNYISNQLKEVPASCHKKLNDTIFHKILKLQKKMNLSYFNLIAQKIPQEYIKHEEEPLKLNQSKQVDINKADRLQHIIQLHESSYSFRTIYEKTIKYIYDKSKQAKPSSKYVFFVKNSQKETFEEVLDFYEQLYMSLAISGFQFSCSDIQCFSTLYYAKQCLAQDWVYLIEKYIEEGDFSKSRYEQIQQKIEYLTQCKILAENEDKKQIQEQIYKQYKLAIQKKTRVLASVQFVKENKTFFLLKDNILYVKCDIFQTLYQSRSHKHQGIAQKFNRDISQFIKGVSADQASMSVKINKKTQNCLQLQLKHNIKLEYLAMILE